MSWIFCSCNTRLRYCWHNPLRCNAKNGRLYPCSCYMSHLHLVNFWWCNGVLWILSMENILESMPGHQHDKQARLVMWVHSDKKEYLHRVSLLLSLITVMFWSFHISKWTKMANILISVFIFWNEEWCVFIWSLTFVGFCTLCVPNSFSSGQVVRAADWTKT